MRRASAARRASPGSTLTLRSLLVLGAGLALLSGCASSGSSSSSSGNWLQTPAEGVPYDTLIVVAIAPDSNAREAFEQNLVRLIDEGGGRGIQGHRQGRRMGQNELTTELLIRMVNETGADGVLVTRVLDADAARGMTQEEAIVHVGPQANVQQNEAGNMTAVLVSNYSVEVVPGQQTIKANSQLESMIFQPHKTDQVIYRAATDARFEFGPGDRIELAAAQFAETIAEELSRDGVIR